MSAPATPFPPARKVGLTEIRIKGRDTSVPSLQIDACTVISPARSLKIAQLFDEELVERAALPHPDIIIPTLHSSPLKADVFTFAQRVPDTSPRFPFHVEWDNWAIVQTTSFQQWWDALPQESRKNARQAEKR